MAAALALCTVAGGAQSGNQGRVASDFMREGRELAACGSFSLANVAECAQTLVTGQPLHIALGSLAPQNGFAGGLAFVEHKDFADAWRMTFNTDAVATGNASWRAGAYLKAFKLGGGRIVAVYPGSTPIKKQERFFNNAPLFNLYAETTSLNHIDFYGLGRNTLPAGRSGFGLTETIAGVSAIVPTRVPGFSLYAELNGRVPRVRPGGTSTLPSIAQVYSRTDAPGLGRDAAFVEPGEGVRLQPQLFGDRLRLHYLLTFENFLALSAPSSFRRWTADLGHEFPLDRKVRLVAPNERNGPDSCTTDPGTRCPSPVHVSRSLDHEGSVNVRLLMQGSAAGAGNAVPFYFDPTVGGSDLNGQALLPSYADYRFRAPNLLLLRGTIEHSLPRIPAGVYVSVDEGKAALTRNDIDFSHLRHSYTAGLTVHAGGLPVVFLLFSWDGGEGSHGTASVSNVLLGASARPSRF
jgi:hypothetical protein